MRDLYRDVRHLVRIAALFAAGIVVFIVARAVFVPEDFGRLGHYRASAIEDNQKHERVFAGREACATCHDDVFASRAGGAHAEIGCEACHGALAAHADAPETVAPDEPDSDALCASCHRTSAARPEWFPQVVPAEHAMGDPCGACHEPHDPGFEQEGA